MRKLNKTGKSLKVMNTWGKRLCQYLLLSIALFVVSDGSKHRAIKTRQNNLCTNQPVGAFVANPQDCHLFYLCTENGQAVSAACPLNMLFNPQSKLCDLKANVQCRLLSQASTTALTTQSLPTSAYSTIQEYCVNAFEQQPNSDSLIFLAHPSKCNQYYMCYYGQALLHECSTDLQWNFRTGKCDFPANSKCQTQVGTITLPTVSTETSSAGNNGIMCPVYGQHIFPHTQHCNKFIYCVKGHFILQQCPFYQYFDVESSRCISRKRALCIKDLKLQYKRNTF